MTKAFVSLTSCRRAAATICPRPGLQVVTRYTSYTHMDRSLTRCPCWPASTANHSGPVTFDLLTLKVVFELRVTWATSVPILVFLGLSCVLDLRPDVRDRRTDVRQTDTSDAHHRLMHPGRGHNNISAVARHINNMTCDVSLTTRTGF